MEIQINRDPQDINKSFIGGHKWWQYLTIALAFVVVIIFTLAVDMSSTANGIICAVIAAPLGYVGVFKKNGLDFFEYYGTRHKNQKGRSVYTYTALPCKAKEAQALTHKTKRKGKVKNGQMGSI